ncbi:MAG: Pyruvate dehydrogenase complex repressor [Chloroflexi bacterium ADurb.Bin360]|nr:MAG: Pyruvate dehydrogenase complex repressor [Chloroflexi bacterium ADurb.Bin360]
MSDMLSYTKVRSPRMQVEDVLGAMIASLSPGEQLPPEPTLAKDLGVSRATLREVMRTFVERGVLVRRHGVGTFVASRMQVIANGLEVLEPLEVLAGRIGLDTTVKELEIEERPATLVEKAGLGLPAEVEAPVLSVTRVISIGETPVADLRDVVPLTYLTQADLGSQFRGSVLELLLQRGEPLLSASRTQIMAESADAKFARRLNVPRGAALLRLVAQLYSYDEKVVDFSVSYFVPGHFQFHVMRKVQG